jgi:hypothetical protein
MLEIYAGLRCCRVHRGRASRAIAATGQRGLIPAIVWTGGRFAVGLGAGTGQMCAITGSTQGEEPRAAPGRPGDGACDRQGNKDTLYRIHGTVEPWTIGKNVSSGCIRMINQDVIDLHERTPIGARVQVLPSRASALRP